MAEVQSEKKPAFSESDVCEQCGRFGAFRFTDAVLCPDCYESCGSCCPEFNREKTEQ